MPFLIDTVMRVREILDIVVLVGYFAFRLLQAIFDITPCFLIILYRTEKM